MRPWSSTLLALVAATALWPEPARGESVLEDRPAPDSVEEMSSAFQRGFERRVRAESLFPRLKDLLRDMPPVLSDAHVVLRPRTYFLRSRDGNNDVTEGWAIGGSLFFESGWHKETLAVGGELYTSQKLVGVAEREGTRLLQPGQEGYTVLGQLYGRIKHGDHVFTGYRQKLDLPYVNSNDSRMTPRTFEGYTLRGEFLGLPGPQALQYGAGYLTQTKARNEDHFIHMSEAAGVPGTSSHGMAYAGLRFVVSDALSFGAVDYYVKDTINIAFAKVDGLLFSNDVFGLRLQAQFSHQRSVGKQELTGSRFRTWNLNGRVAASYGGAILALGFSTTDSGARIRSPFGGDPSFLSIMQRDFNLADEDAWLVTLTYDFARIGCEGLSGFVNYVEGYDSIDAGTGLPLADRREFDATLDYRFEKAGLMRGFWLRLRASILQVDGQRKTSNQVRAIVNYEIPIL